jgi:hypothetical protein
MYYIYNFLGNKTETRLMLFLFIVTLIALLISFVEDKPLVFFCLYTLLCVIITGYYIQSVYGNSNYNISRDENFLIITNRENITRYDYTDVASSDIELDLYNDSYNVKVYKNDNTVVEFSYPRVLKSDLKRALTNPKTVLSYNTVSNIDYVASFRFSLLVSVLTFMLLLLAGLFHSLNSKVEKAFRGVLSGKVSF